MRRRSLSGSCEVCDSRSRSRSCSESRTASNAAPRPRSRSKKRFLENLLDVETIEPSITLPPLVDARSHGVVRDVYDEEPLLFDKFLVGAHLRDSKNFNVLDILKW